MTTLKGLYCLLCPKVVKIIEMALALTGTSSIAKSIAPLNPRIKSEKHEHLYQVENFSVRKCGNDTASASVRCGRTSDLTEHAIRTSDSTEHASAQRFAFFACSHLRHSPLARSSHIASRTHLLHVVVLLAGTSSHC